MRRLVLSSVIALGLSGCAMCVLGLLCVGMCYVVDNHPTIAQAMAVLFLWLVLALLIWVAQQKHR